jgi:long-chain acyl-CoA synthetase
LDAVRPAVLIADTGATLSHAELDEQSARLARDLHDRGLRPGDTVALLSGRCLESFVVHRAVRRAGLALLALDASLPVEEIAYVVNDSAARALVAAGELAGVAASLRPLTPYVAVRYSLDADLPDGSAPAVLAPAPVAPHVFYSSGTTGRPRGARRHGLVAGVVPELLHVGWAGTSFSAGPWSDPVVAQVFEATLEAGGTVVTLTSFEAPAALRAIAEHQPNLVHLLPWHVLRLMKLGEVPPELAQVQAWLLSSAACPPLAKRWLVERVGLSVYELYGGAQCDVLTVVDARDWLLRPGTVGRALRGRLRVCGEDGKELPTGQVGVVYFESPPFLQRTPEVKESRARTHPVHKSWFTLGDVGRVDAEGFLYLRDHESFLVDSQQERVFARDLEDLLVVHPKVRDAGILGTADARLRAVIELEDGVSAGPGVEAQLRAYLLSRLPASQLPHVVDFVSTLPRTSTGKLVKRRLAPRFALSDSMSS